MQITILNGDMGPEDSRFSRSIDELGKILGKNHRVEIYPLNRMDLRYCIGCWNCWWKTPGRCIHQDEGEKIFRSVIHSDFIVLASPLIAGFPSSAVKKIMDRLIVLMHPYLKMIHGECHHIKRYEKYPDFGLVLEKEPDTDEEDLDIINTIFDRFSINSHNHRKYTKTLDGDSMEDIARETCCL
jgi:multimeric flavodoxin WrbA